MAGVNEDPTTSEMSRSNFDVKGSRKKVMAWNPSYYSANSEILRENLWKGAADAEDDERSESPSLYDRLLGSVGSDPVDPPKLQEDADGEENVFSESSESTTIMKAFLDVCDRLYPRTTLVVVVFSYIHFLCLTAIGVSASSGKIPSHILEHAFASSHSEEYRLSPFSPVWYNIERFPWDAFFSYMNGHVWLNAFMYLVIIFLSLSTYWEPLRKSKDERLLLLFTTALMCGLKLITLLTPSVYTTVVIHLNGDMMLRMMGVYYDVLGTDSFTNVCNMIMLLGKCCGVDGPSERYGGGLPTWGPYNLTVVPEYNPYEKIPAHGLEKIPQWPNKKMTIFFKVPAACCPQVRLDEEPDEDWASLRKCVSGQGETGPYRAGCRHVFEDLFERRVLPFLIADDVFMFTLQLLFTVLNAMKLYKNRHGFPDVNDDVMGEDGQTEEEDGDDDSFP